MDANSLQPDNPPMRLPDFIQSNIEAILVDWEDFARSIWPKDSPANPIDLRDSAEEIIRAVVVDMANAESLDEQSEKSMGRGVGGKESDRLDDASTVHGIARVASGLSIMEVVSEYRALRASILRLWRKSQPVADLSDIDGITRFNEAIDQSLAQAIEGFTKRLEGSRQMFLAILGHDLRTPLSAITLSAKLAESPSTEDERAYLLSTINNSAKAVSELITDLIDFTSSTLGVRVPIALEQMDLSRLCQDVVGECRAANPGREVKCVVSGNVVGRWDAHRLRQVAANLLGNAMQHGLSTEPVTLSIDGTADNVVKLTVHNHGEPIPHGILPTLFDPLVRGRSTVEKRTRPGSIGLGLYIAREIVLAHGGTIAITSAKSTGTTATVRLPR